MISIRTASTEDMVFLGKFYPQENLGEVGKGNPHIFVIEEDGKIFGAAGAQMREDAVLISFLTLDRKYQDKGYEDGLIRAFINFCDRRGKKELKSIVEIPNNIYEKIGFKGSEGEWLLDIDEFFNNQKCCQRPL